MLNVKEHFATSTAESSSWHLPDQKVISNLDGVQRIATTAIRVYCEFIVRKDVFKKTRA